MWIPKTLSAAAAAFALFTLGLAGEASAYRDHDGNPPGPAGGPGTNWENPRGPAGGPGASPDYRRYYYDHDNNPPGPAGGPGTNWENPPGWVGGPGASPNYRGWRHTYWGGGVWVWHPARLCWFPDPDGNPPGPAGGPGTNWENPPGPIGGPGASPDRRACY
jgi:hypothetical protein